MKTILELHFQNEVSVGEQSNRIMKYPDHRPKYNRASTIRHAAPSDIIKIIFPYDIKHRLEHITNATPDSLKQSNAILSILALDIVHIAYNLLNVIELHLITGAVNKIPHAFIKDRLINLSIFQIFQYLNIRWLFDVELVIVYVYGLFPYIFFVSLIVA